MSFSCLLRRLTVTAFSMTLATGAIGVGCSATALPSSFTEGDAGIGTGGGARDASHAASVCGFTFTGDCASCVETSCCAEWQACGGTESCSSLDACLLACNGAMACLQACSNAVTMDVVNLYNDGATCLANQCAAACYGTIDGGSWDASEIDSSFDAGFPGDDVPDAGRDAGALSGCAYAQCPTSITCGSPQGSHGSYPLGCVDGARLVSSERSPAVCVIAFETGLPGVLTFPETYTCNEASIVCDWPEGNITCPVLWNIPDGMGGTNLNGGCCGFLASTDSTPSCGIMTADGNTGLFGCAAPGPNDTPE